MTDSMNHQSCACLPLRGQRSLDPLADLTASRLSHSFDDTKRAGTQSEMIMTDWREGRRVSPARIGSGTAYAVRVLARARWRADLDRDTSYGAIGSANNRRPSALATLRTVSKRGFAPGVSAL